MRSSCSQGVCESSSVRSRLAPTSLAILPPTAGHTGPSDQSPGRLRQVATVVTQKQGWGWGSSMFSARLTASSGARSSAPVMTGIGSAIGNASPSRNMIRSSSAAT